MVTKQEMAKIEQEILALIAATPISKWDDESAVEVLALLDKVTALKAEVEAA